VNLSQVPETAIPAGRWQPLNERLGDEELEAGPGDVVGVPDPAETRNYWALEPGTRIVCLGAGPGAEHPYGRWIAEDAATE